MNKLVLLVILCCGFLPVNIQGQEVLYSQYDKFDFRSGDFSVVGKVGSRTYMYRSTPDGFYLDSYNDKMERQAIVLLDFFPKKIYETRFINYPDKIIVLYQSVEKGLVIQHAALLDEAGRLKARPIALDTAKTGFFGPNKEYFSSAVSDDKQNILVYAANDKGGTLNFTGKWLNSELQVTNAATAAFTTENDIAHGEGLLSNNGTLYLPVYTPVGSKQFADQLWLLSLQAGNGQFASAELPLNTRYAAGTYMKLDNVNNRVYVGGFYSEKKNGNYEGVLYTYYDIASGTFANRKEIQFTGNLRSATGERNAKKAFNDFQVRQLMVKNDGGFVLVAEDFFVTTRNNYGPGYGYYNSYYPTMSSSVREYNYGDILVMSYNAEGNMEWNTFIRKNQYSQEDGGLFSSYAFVNTGGALGFMFNDFNSARSRIQLASVDGDGKLSTRSLAAGRQDDPDWLPRSGKQIAAKEIVVPCLRRRQICFAKIVF